MAQFSKTILTKTINFFSRSRSSLLGGIIVGILSPVLLVSIFLDMQGVVQNPYFGFLIYLVMGPLFVLGLLLIIGGTLFGGKKEDLGQLTVEYIKEELNRPGHFTRIRKLMFITSLITVVTLIIVGVVTYTGFHYTETVSFCARFCHSVMEPEYVTYKNSAHSQVSCVKCHIGTNSQWVTKSKFSGARQLAAVAFDSYSRPLKTPISSLRPKRKICENCHRPEVFHGDKLYIQDKFLPDEQNTHVQTVMVMKIGSGDISGREAHDIHWHISDTNKVTFVASEDHLEIYQVRLTGPDQETVVYRKKGVDGEVHGEGIHEQTMDCMDCHNRPTHVFLSPEEAMDNKIVNGVISREIPYIKRQGVEAIVKKYPSQDAARRSIAKELMDWYRTTYPEIVAQNEDLMKRAVKGVQGAYVENVFPRMNIEWNTYMSFISHREDSGCFRCHNDDFESKTGKKITQDCDACHIILVEDEPARDIADILRSSMKKQVNDPAE